MKILKRNGREVNFNPSKIIKRIKDQSSGLKVDYDNLSIKIISQIADGMSTRELDNLSVEAAAMKVVDHPDYSTLASRLFITSLRKDTPDRFSELTNILSEHKVAFSEEYLLYVENNMVELDNMIVQDRDFNHDIFGLKTLERAYLLKDKNDRIWERPQYMWMRTAIEVSGYDSDLLKIKETYDLLSQGYYTHATPTLFNSGMKLSQLSSCFLLANKGDSIDGLGDTIKDTMKISKLSGGIGVHIHDVRAKGSHVYSTNGKSDGIIPMLKTYNEVARWINQGGKRKGSFAFYLEPWHADIFDFLDLKKNHGKEEMRARDLFYAIWTNDLFMERVMADQDWTLFCPNEVLIHNGTVLQDLVGEEFKSAYIELEKSGVGRKTIRARELWEKILVSQIETGVPYLAYKDKVNLASNQKNLGTIRSSNLCIEINEFSSSEEQAVCNLASIALNKFIKYDRDSKPHFNFSLMRDVTKTIIRNLDNVIDVNYYPTPETKISNSRHRPIGLGVQGLADTYALLRMSFDSEEARALNKEIFENLYFAALESSNELATLKGKYSSFNDSPASQGILQFDMYRESPALSSYLDWKGLKNNIQKNGLRNSLLLALMPTASTSQILGNNECFEPFTSNLGTRRTLAGEYIVINKHLVRDLESEGLWTPEIRNQLKAENGSVMNLPIPTWIKELYKTAYEISQKHIINQAADRQRFVCQSQSMNLFMADPDFGKLSSMHMYGWKNELKTGIYYLRSKPAVNAIKFTVESSSKKDEVEEFRKMLEQSRRASQSEDEDCLMCGS